MNEETIEALETAALIAETEYQIKCSYEQFKNDLKAEYLRCRNVLPFESPEVQSWLIREYPLVYQK